MIIHPQLDNFTDDAIQQQSTVSAVRDTMQQWKNSVIGKIQRAHILKAGESSTAQNCIESLRPLFDDLSWLFDMTKKLCDIQSKNHFTNIELRSSKNDRYNTIILHQESKFALHLCIAKPRNLNQGNFIFGPDLIMLSAIDDTQIFTAQLDENDNLCGTEILSCDNEELIIYDNRRKFVNFITQNDAIIFLRAIIKTSSFDKNINNITHHYLHFNDTHTPIKKLADNRLLRAQMIFSILRHQHYKKAIPVFAEWVRNDVPDIRWYVMREFLALDIEAALPHLLFMADYDENRSVRKAALDTLQILKRQYPEICGALQA